MKEKTFLKNGYEYVTDKIREAVENGSRTATVTGAWEIAKEVRLPSFFTLILEDCHLKTKDGSFTNIFVNENHGTDIGKAPEGADRQITLKGVGEAVLDGGVYNGLSEKTQLKDGLPPIWKNNLLLFTNVDGFHVSGIRCINQRWWALNFIYCRNGYLGNIDFCASDIGIDKDGVEYHGLKRDCYSEVLVKNADGIDLRQGCHHIKIENITGFTEDDTVALTGLSGRLEETFAVSGLPSDISDVEIRNVRASAYCTNVRLLNQGGIKLHDIYIDGVYDTSFDSPHLDRGIYAVRIGDTHLYGSRHATSDETYNITVKNVKGRGLYVLSLAGEIGNLLLSDIEALGGAKLILDQRGAVI